MPFPYLNRSAVIVQPKKEFYDWINSVDPIKLDESIFDPAVYLVDELESKEELENWLKENYIEIFISELFSWYTDEELWPANRDYISFLNFFHVSFHPTVIDTVEEDFELS